MSCFAGIMKEWEVVEMKSLHGDPRGPKEEFMKKYVRKFWGKNAI